MKIQMINYAMNVFIIAKNVLILNLTVHLVRVQIGQIIILLVNVMMVSLTMEQILIVFNVLKIVLPAYHLVYVKLVIMVTI